MSATRYSIYEIQLQDMPGGVTINSSGGACLVVTAGDSTRVTLYNADTFAALANPVVPTNGRFRFATLATIASVDLYGMGPTGACFVRKGVTPGTVQEVFINPWEMNQTLIIPWAAADVTANTEFDTGFDLPARALVMPWVANQVTVVDATETIDVGLLSSESGGDADGFIALGSVATLGQIRAFLLGTDTLGALLKEDTNGSTVNVPATYSVGLTAKGVSLTTSAGSDTGKGFIAIPFMLPVTQGV